MCKRVEVLVVLFTFGILWLAATHPGHAASPAARLGSVAAPRRFSLDDQVGFQRPAVAIGPITARGLTLSTALAVDDPDDLDDSLYVFWPPRPEKPRRRSRPPVLPPVQIVARVPEPRDTATTENDAEMVATVRPNLPPLVYLVTPNRGDALTCDTTWVIGWRAEDDQGVARIRLEFSADGGRHWNLLADSLGNYGEWRWRVPWIETRRGRLRVTAHDDSSLAGVDVSDRNFSIARPAWMTRGRSLLTLRLDGPIPNPVRDACRFLIGMPEAGLAELVLFAVSGRVIRRLWSGPLNVGSHPIDWDGRNDSGEPATSGVYFARLITIGSRIARRLVLVR